MSVVPHGLIDSSLAHVVLQHQDADVFLHNDELLHQEHLLARFEPLTGPPLLHVLAPVAVAECVLVSMAISSVVYLDVTAERLLRLESPVQQRIGCYYRAHYVL